jgi:hypothetical protein
MPLFDGINSHQGLALLDMTFQTNRTMTLTPEMFRRVVEMTIERRLRGLPPMVPRTSSKDQVPSAAPMARTEEASLLFPDPLSATQHPGPAAAIPSATPEAELASVPRLMCLTPFISPLMDLKASGEPTSSNDSAKISSLLTSGN